MRSLPETDPMGMPPPPGICEESWMIAVEVKEVPPSSGELVPELAQGRDLVARRWRWTIWNWTGPGARRMRRRKSYDYGSSFTDH